MARRVPVTLADYMIVGINPALIMVLIGSLVFFLIEVFYRGQYEGRLHFIFAMFIMGAVAVGRISMEEGSSYASMFGAPLAIVVFLAVNQFVQFSGAALYSFIVNATLIALIWWLAYKLTWDCTLIDDRADTSDQGLLHAVGAGEQSNVPTDNTAEEPLDPALLAATTSREPIAEPSWYEQFFKRKQQPHAHGVWVIYFSLPALAMFGLGQWFLPTDKRGFAFFMLVVFVASALALLVNTSFLGLRRYLRKRHLAMPVEMAATWLGAGAAIIAIVLIVCLLLPRPGAELAISQPPISITTKDLSPSRWNWGRDGQKKDDDSRAASQKADPQSKQSGADETKPGTKGQGSQGDPSNQGKSSDSSSAKNPDSSKTQSEMSESGKGEKSGEKGSNSSEQGQPKSGEKGGEKGNSADKSGDKSKEANQNQGDPGSQSSQNKSPGDKQDQQSKQQQPAQTPPPAPRPQSNFSLSSLFGALGWFIKLLLYLVAAAIVAFVAWKYRAQIAAAWAQLIKELRELWNRLFGDKEREALAAQQAEAAAMKVARPFSSFANPFATGQAARMNRQEVIRYSFEALEAWGRDNGCARHVSETPFEYCQRLATFAPHLGREAMALADYYGMAAYASAMLPASIAGPVQSLWGKMQQGMRAPV